jgi:hypothetical protein
MPSLKKKVSAHSQNKKCEQSQKKNKEVKRELVATTPE